MAETDFGSSNSDEVGGWLGRRGLCSGHRLELLALVRDDCATYERRSPAGELLAAELVHDVALTALAASGILLRSAADQLAELSPIEP